MKKIILTFLIIFFIFFPVFAGGSKEKTKKSDVIIDDSEIDSSKITEIHTGQSVLVTVKLNSNSEKSDNITRSMVEKTIEQYKEQQYEITVDEAISVLVSQSLISQFVSNLGSQLTEEQINSIVSSAIVTSASQYGLNISTAQEAEDFVKNFYGMSVTDYANTVLSSLLLDSYVTEKYSETFSNIPEVTDEEIKSFYNEHIDSFNVPASARIAHIFKIFGENEKENSEIKADMEKIRESILSDKISFEQAVIDYSDDVQSAKSGGIINGWLTNGSDAGLVQLGQDAMDVVFDLKIGQISKVVKGVSGFHIFKLINYRAAGLLTLDDYYDLNSQITVENYLKTSLNNAVYQRALLVSYGQLVNDLKEDAIITYSNK